MKLTSSEELLCFPNHGALLHLCNNDIYISISANSLALEYFLLIFLILIIMATVTYKENIILEVSILSLCN